MVPTAVKPETIVRMMGQTGRAGRRQMLGLHKQFVSPFELGERRLDAVEFADVARALGVEAGQLLEQVTSSE